MKGYKTIVIAALTFLGYAFAWPQITDYVDPQYVAMGSSVVMAMLRFVTTGPVANKT